MSEPTFPHADADCNRYATRTGTAAPCKVCHPVFYKYAASERARFEHQIAVLEAEVVRAATYTRELEQAIVAAALKRGAS